MFPCLSRAGKKKCHQAGVQFTLLPDESCCKKPQNEYDQDLVHSNNLDMHETNVSNTVSHMDHDGKWSASANCFHRLAARCFRAKKLSKLSCKLCVDTGSASGQDPEKTWCDQGPVWPHKLIENADPKNMGASPGLT